MAGTEKSLRGQVFDKIRSDILNIKEGKNWLKVQLEKNWESAGRR